MPIDLYRNSGIYNMIAEGEIADILSNFNSAYVMDVIDSNLRNRFAYNPTLSNPNIVNSYELNFKGMLANFPTDADNIMSIRQETYLDIINKICNTFNMQYIGDEPDCYTLAYNVYDLFVSGYARNIINFFSRYIYRYCAEIYNNMGLEKYKKNKDSTTSYIRKAYGNVKYVDIIIARIREVVYYISGFDIDFYTFLTFNYSREMCDFLYANIVPLGNIFKDEFCKVVDNPAILTEIRIAIQNLLEQDLKSQEQQLQPNYNKEQEDFDEEDQDNESNDNTDFNNLY